jgi:hypothetical protein
MPAAVKSPQHPPGIDGINRLPQWLTVNPDNDGIGRQYPATRIPPTDFGGLRRRYATNEIGRCFAQPPAFIDGGGIDPEEQP